MSWNWRPRTRKISKERMNWRQKMKNSFENWTKLGINMKMIEKN